MDVNGTVFHVMGMDSSKYGGVERFNVALSKALLERGYRSVFVYDSEPSDKQFLDDIEKNGGEILVKNARKNPILFCIWYKRALRRYRPEIVHAHFTKARFYAIPMARLMGVKKLFFTIHSAMDTKDQIKLLTRLWYAVANKMAKVIAVSDNIATSYNDNWPQSQVERVYLGVEKINGTRVECRDKLDIPSDQIVLLTVANFNHIKGLDVLVKAVKILNDKGVMNGQTCLYIVGQPQVDREELESLIEQLGIGESIKMVGISNAVSDYMCAADLYIQPSRSEGLPMALMEAASAGLPLIGTKVGGIPEIVKDGCNGILVDVEDERQLANAIGNLLYDNGLRKRYGENGLKLYSESFSITSGVNNTISYYGL